MTRANLAAQLAELRPTARRKSNSWWTWPAAVSRSQLAAILGNVLVAAPIALLLSALFTVWHSAPPVDMARRSTLLADGPRAGRCRTRRLPGLSVFVRADRVLPTRPPYDDI